MNINISLNIDFDLLRKQKETLMTWIEVLSYELPNTKQTFGSMSDIRDLIGLLHLIEAIQDEAVEILDPGMVFGGAKE